MQKLTCKNMALLAVSLVTSATLLAQATSQTYSSAGTHTFTVPAGYSAEVKIEAWGAGGGGGGNFGTRGAGGGGGAYAAKSSITLAPGNYSVVVGKGGAGAIREVFNSSNAQNGGNSTFNGTVVVAHGGNAGTVETGGNGGTASVGAGYTSFVGGNGGNTALYFTNGSGGGGSAWATVKGNNGGDSQAGDGGPGGTGEGTGGEGGSVGDVPGSGLYPGGGGGGKNVAYGTSGSGANGRVIVTVISNTTLSVNFGGIHAQVSNNSAVLNFTTLSETNNSYFNIQASKDGVNFETITTVQSKHIDGNASDATSYSISLDLSGKFALGFSMAALLGLGLFGFKNRKSRILFAIISLGVLSFTLHSCSKNVDGGTVNADGKTYLRIQQIDKNGASTYSKVITITKA